MNDETIFHWPELEGEVAVTATPIPVGMTTKGQKLISIGEFQVRLGTKSRSTFLKYERALPGFPKRVQLSRCKVMYLESEVDAWIAAARGRAA